MIPLNKPDLIFLDVNVPEMDGVAMMLRTWHRSYFLCAHADRSRHIIDGGARQCRRESDPGGQWAAIAARHGH